MSPDTTPFTDLNYPINQIENAISTNNVVLLVIGMEQAVMDFRGRRGSNHIGIKHNGLHFDGRLATSNSLEIEAHYPLLRQPVADIEYFRYPVIKAILGTTSSNE